MTTKKYFVTYSGNHTGKYYDNNVIGICDTNEEAKQMIKDLLKDDLITYKDLFNKTSQFVCVDNKSIKTIQKYKTIEPDTIDEIDFEKTFYITFNSLVFMKYKIRYTEVYVNNYESKY